MSDENPTGSDDLIARYMAPGSDNVKMIYVLYLLSTLLAITALVGLVIAYLCQDRATGWVASHYTYLIRTFWIGLLYALVSAALMFVGIGFLLIIGVAVWAVVRCAKGLMWACDGEPVPDPRTFWI